MVADLLGIESGLAQDLLGVLAELRCRASRRRGLSVEVIRRSDHAEARTVLGGDTLSTQLEGAPDVVPEAISTAHTLSEIIVTRRTQLGELITGAERVTTVIRNQESNIGPLMVQSRNLMVELTRRRDAVTGMFNATTALVAQLHRITVVNRPALDALIEDLNGMLGALARHDDLLRNTLQALPLPVRNFTNATGADNYVDFTGPAGSLIDSWMCALSGRAEQVGRAPYFEDCR